MGILGLYEHSDISVDLRTGKDVPLPLACGDQCQLAIVVDLPEHGRLKETVSHDLMIQLFAPLSCASMKYHGQAIRKADSVGAKPILQRVTVDSQGRDYARRRFPECFDLRDRKLSMAVDLKVPRAVYVSRGCGRRMIAAVESNGALFIRSEPESAPLDVKYQKLDDSSIGHCMKLKDDQPLVRHIIGLSVGGAAYRSSDAFIGLRVGSAFPSRQLEHFQVALNKKALTRGLPDAKLIKSYKEFCTKASAMNLDNILVRQSRTQATLIAWQSNPGNLHRELVQYHDCLASLPTYEEVVNKDGPSEILNPRRCFRRTLTLSKYDDDLSAWAQADLIPGTNEIIDI